MSIRRGQELVFSVLILPTELHTWQGNLISFMEEFTVLLSVLVAGVVVAGFSRLGALLCCLTAWAPGWDFPL